MNNTEIFGLPMVELIGYIGSVIIALSMLMTSLLRLRWVIFFGNIVFIIYGSLIGAYPIIALNIFQLAVNSFFIIQAYTLKGNYILLHPHHDDAILDRFLVYYADDIKKIFPKFEMIEKKDIIYLIVKGTAAIGVTTFRKTDNNSHDIIIDYIAKTHRNMKPGKMIFIQENIFEALNTKEIHTNSFTKKHTKYLLKMGFKPTEKPNHFILTPKNL